MHNMQKYDKHITRPHTHIHTHTHEDPRHSQLTSHPCYSQLHDDPHEELAKMIFMELSEAWARFEEEGMKSLY